MTAIPRQPKSPRALSGLNLQHRFTIPISQYPKQSLYFTCSYLWQADGIFRCVQLVLDYLDDYVKIRLKVSALEINTIKIYGVLRASFNCSRKMFWFGPRCTHLCLISFNCVLKYSISGDLKCREESIISVQMCPSP